MEATVGTFNLNNLFSRFNFRAHVDEVPEEERDVIVTFEFTEEGDYWFRTFRGRLIQPMPPEQVRTLAGRIQAMDLDVLAVQEVEDIEALRDFNREFLGGMYVNAVLIEGNDPRFIDVGVLSKPDFPIGAVTSWQHRVHPQDPSRRVGRPGGRTQTMSADSARASSRGESGGMDSRPGSRFFAATPRSIARHLGGD
jgi:hypothetical protein